MEEPFIPFYRPYGMSDEQFEEEVRVAQDLHDLWLYKQSKIKPILSEQEQMEENLWYETLKEELEQTSYKNWHV